ncbi:MAG: tetratricopeptide repeat protein [Limisphaerales bacterium]
MAMTLNNLGNLLTDQQDAVGARQAYEEALTIRRELAAAIPEIFRPAMASTLNNLGSLMHEQQDAAGSRQAYEEALTIRRELAAANPEAFTLELCRALLSMAKLEVGADVTGQAAAQQHISEAEKLLRGFPESPLRNGLSVWAKRLRGQLKEA